MKTCIINDSEVIWIIRGDPSPGTSIYLFEEPFTEKCLLKTSYIFGNLTHEQVKIYSTKSSKNN